MSSSRVGIYKVRYLYHIMIRALSIKIYSATIRIVMISTILQHYDFLAVYCTSQKEKSETFTEIYGIPMSVLEKSTSLTA